MKNEELIVLEADEMMETSGGLLPMIAGAYLGIAMYEIMDNPGEVWSGFAKSFGF